MRSQAFAARYAHVTPAESGSWRRGYLFLFNQCVAELIEDERRAGQWPSATGG